MSRCITRPLSTLTLEIGYSLLAVGHSVPFDNGAMPAREDAPPPDDGIWVKESEDQAGGLWIGIFGAYNMEGERPREPWWAHCS